MTTENSSEWINTSLGEACQFVTGFPFPSAQFAAAGRRLVRGSNVKRGVLDWSPNITRYWPKVETRLRPYDLWVGDIVVAMDGALVGRSFARVDAADLPAYLVQRVARLRGYAVDQGLLYQWMNSSQFQAWVDERKTHTAIPHISPADISEFPIEVPRSREEQCRIGLALDDADALIASLERLIAKKRDVKLGMMQELLTGRTRLPGFTGEWREATLGELGVFLKGRGIKRDDVRASGVPCIRYGELYTTHRNYTRATVSFVDASVAEAALPIRRGDILFAGSGETKAEIGMAAAYVGASNAVAGGDIIVLRGRGFDPIFLGSLLNTPSLTAQKASFGQGDAVVHIGAAALEALRFRLPGREEQVAIASALQDADAEIEALEQRLESARAVKVGMMQELLTGRTRLPVEEDA